ncbi:MAG: DGQHR domain-containing protein [Pseudomonadota bacterium]
MDILRMGISEAQVVGALARTEGERKSEYAKRRKGFNEESVPTALLTQREAEGWLLLRENKTSVRIRRPKSFDEVLENRFWNVLYRFGYDELNAGRRFRIRISAEGEELTKQIDVFAKDAETLIVAECKASEKPRKRSMQKDLGEFAALQKPIANALRKHYGAGFKPKILWFFVTDKIRWSDNDLQRASDNNIHVVQSRELLYFEEISKKLGVAARFQFHAEYLDRQKVPALSNRTVQAVKTKIGGHIAYFFSARPVDILRIAFVNHRDLRDPTGAPSYQRLVSPSRLKEIGSFLDAGGYFPNTILLNFHRKPQFNRQAKDDFSNIQFGELVLPDRYKSCWVIDGQHRLYGTTFAKKRDQDAPLFFIAFENVTRSEEANTFVTINEKQTRVPKKLLTELDGELKWDSDNPKELLGAIASRAVDLLNNKGAGPFENRVVTPGVTGSSDQPLTLPNFQQAILQSRLVGSVNPRNKELIHGPCWDQNAEGSLLRLVELLSWYFSKLEELNPERWNSGKVGYLCSNFGIFGHVRLLGELIRFAAKEQDFDPVECELEEITNTLELYLGKVFDFVKAADEETFVDRFKVPFGSGGPARYFFRLVELVRQGEANFAPEGFEDFIQTMSAEVVQQADDQVRWVQTIVPDYVVGVLKNEYGERFFEMGVPKEIQKACQTKRIDDDVENQLPIEAYLDWLQIRKIVEQRKLRDKFKDVLSIQMDDEPNGRHFYASWFDRMNEVRRIPAHPAGRQYKAKDTEFLNAVVSSLKEQLPEEYIEMANAPVS